MCRTGLNPGCRTIDKLILYSTDSCHLCHQAEELLRAVVAGGAPVEWEVVDIAGDHALFERYGWSIPVLRRTDGKELSWPFDITALSRFLDGI